MMGSLFGAWPSNNPQHFSQFRPSDHTTPPKRPPPTYLATHNTLPPPDHDITSECILDFLRRMSEKDAEKKLRQKLAASEFFQAT